MRNSYLSLMVADLPDCYVKEQLTKFVIDPSVARIWVVAVEGSISDWAAYIGWPTIEHLADQNNHEHVYYAMSLHNPESVMNNGDKLPESVARKLFPHIRLAYRE